MPKRRNIEQEEKLNDKAGEALGRMRTANEIWEYIFSLIYGHGCSIASVSRAVYGSPQTMHTYKYLKIMPTADRLAMLSGVLDVTADEILFKQGSV